ncbi:4-hydroxybenzoate transporter [Pandoraea terrae]|uniref:4-hydroxybenzoate transporter n=1 Tax=Pandoraea terrae TaxID=1537710 RepID=A0A5E4U657_9BURK|nr:MFS transporter [Pandoraea terrae]VVD95557.1 4-hydroxybenzoate transporter [Pandoraea terrae]
MSDRLIDVQEYVNARRISAFQWSIVVVCVLLMVVDVYDVAAIGYSAPLIIEQWQIDKSVFGVIVSAGVFGMAAGALLNGVLTDYLSPKKVLISALLIYALCTIASAYARDPVMLGVLRFFTGCGIGAAVPISVVLTHEYSPQRVRALLTSVTVCGTYAGAVICGWVAAALMPTHGWQIVFLIGGVAPLVLAVICLVHLPEPLQYMVLKHRPARQVARVLRKIDRTASLDGARFTVRVDGADHKQSNELKVILSRRMRLSTLMLWSIYFLGVVVYYVMMSWLPTMLRENGMSIREGALITSLLVTGAIFGALLFGWLMDRFEQHMVLVIGLSTGVVLGGVMAYQINQPAYLPISAFAAGFCTIGTISSMFALAASTYSPDGRTAGISWMNGVGRFGGLLGPIVAAALLRQGMAVGMVLVWLMMVPTGLQVVGLLLKRACARRLSEDRRSPDAGAMMSEIV